MFQAKVVEKIKPTHFKLNNFFFRKSCFLRDNVEKYSTDRQTTQDNIIRRMFFECWIPKATNTHSEHVIIIVFPLLQWLHESASTLRYTYTACIVAPHI